MILMGSITLFVMKFSDNSSNTNYSQNNWFCENNNHRYYSVSVKKVPNAWLQLQMILAERENHFQEVKEIWFLCKVTFPKMHSLTKQMQQKCLTTVISWNEAMFKTVVVYLFLKSKNADLLYMYIKQLILAPPFMQSSYTAPSLCIFW